MGRYLTKRILISIPIFFVITLVVYFLSNRAPGGPMDVVAASSGTLTLEELDMLKASYGLDKPLLTRYGIWLGGMMRGDLGMSYAYGKPVGMLVAERVGPSLLLNFTALIISMILGIGLGIVSACKQYSKFDSVVSGYSYLSQSIPGFFSAFLLIFLFAATLRLLPTSGMYDVDSKSLGALARHMVLPVTALSLGTSGIFIRQSRSAMLEVLNEDYIRTARSKGIRRRAVIVNHAIRNAMLPVITVVGMCMTSMVSGSVVVEQIFGWPGIGSLMMTAIEKRDYPIIMGLTVVISIAVLVINILLDIVYAALDPRISFASGASK
ncbi:MAG: ABC transporter permease [Oscillospiraceae bacterium]|jgi:peptide/nickel transport system permease protein|nr:ABC transporter permease [Oscillospiraceae bacterium]